MTAMAATNPERCPTCDNLAVETAWAQPALLRHGGYGETTATTRRHCPRCGWSLIVAVAAEAP